MDIEHLVSQEENQVFERKLSIKDPSDIGHVICAFANTDGGTLAVGIDDRGALNGIPKDDLDGVQQKISNIVRQCQPAPFADIRLLEKDGRCVVAVLVQPIGEGNVCSFKGKVWIRSGSTNRYLDSAGLVEFLKGRYILSFEDSASEADMGDLDEDKVKAYFRARSQKPPERKIEELLFNIKLVKKVETAKPTNLAVLFFARDVERFIPQVEVKLVRFRGVEPVDIVNHKRFYETILESIGKSIDFIKLNTYTKAEIKGMKRNDIPEYPEPAIREAVINAVGHRDYYNRNSIQVNIFDDRIEITNPGALPKGMTLRELGKLAIHRNPRLYQMLNAANLVEAYGTGISRMIRELRDAGLPDPEFEEIGDFFRVTIYNKRSREMGKLLELLPIQKELLELLKREKRLKTKTFAERKGVSVMTSLKHFKRLESAGLIKKIGKTRGVYYVLKEE